VLRDELDASPNVWMFRQRQFGISMPNSSSNCHTSSTVSEAVLHPDRSITMRFQQTYFFNPGARQPNFLNAGSATFAQLKSPLLPLGCWALLRFCNPLGRWARSGPLIEGRPFSLLARRGSHQAPVFRYRPDNSAHPLAYDARFANALASCCSQHGHAAFTARSPQ